MWALGYDGSNPELYQELGTKFLHDTTPPLAGVSVLSERQRDGGFVVSWRATDDSNIARYDIQVSADGGAWRGWLTGTTAISDVYLGSDGGWEGNSLVRRAQPQPSPPFQNSVRRTPQPGPTQATDQKLG